MSLVSTGINEVSGSLGAKYFEPYQVIVKIGLVSYPPRCIIYFMWFFPEEGRRKAGEDGLNLFKEMSLKGVKPTTSTYIIVLGGLFQARKNCCCEKNVHCSD
jgi:hypothetical protein